VKLCIQSAELSGVFVQRLTQQNAQHTACCSSLSYPAASCLQRYQPSISCCWGGTPTPGPGINRRSRLWCSHQRLHAVAGYRVNTAAACAACAACGWCTGMTCRTTTPLMMAASAGAWGTSTERRWAIQFYPAPASCAGRVAQSL